MKVEELQQTLDELAGPIGDAPEGGLRDVRRIVRRQHRIRTAIASGAVIAVVVVVAAAVSEGNRADRPHVVSPADSTNQAPDPTSPVPETRDVGPATAAPIGDPIDIGLGTVRPIDAGPLATRWGAVVLQAGSGIFVWGGEREAENMGLPGPSAVYSDGAYYDPSAQTWTALPDAPLGTAPWPRGSVGVAVGEVVYVASGRATAAWHLDSRRWTTVTVAPEDLRGLVDAGGRVVGMAMSGRAFELRDAEWRALPAPPVLLTNNRAIWTGQEIVVLGRNEEFGPLSGVALDPGRGRWRTLPDAQLDPRSFDAVWDGNSIVVVDYRNRSARYTPASDSWTMLPPLDADAGEFGALLTTVNGQVAAVLFLNVALLGPSGWSVGDSWPNRPCCGIAALDGAVYLYGYANGARTNQFFVWRPPS